VRRHRHRARARLAALADDDGPGEQVAEPSALPDQATATAPGSPSRMSTGSPLMSVIGSPKSANSRASARTIACRNRSGPPSSRTTRSPAASFADGAAGADRLAHQRIADHDDQQRDDVQRGDRVRGRAGSGQRVQQFVQDQ
jgi:hypothetical protein